MSYTLYERIVDLYVRISSHNSVPLSQRVAGERCVFEFCGGAGGVSRFGEPRSGWSVGWVCVVVDAHDWGDLRRRVSGFAVFADAKFLDALGAGDFVRGADD